ncbi:DUF1127 domain-containing protein [Pikeienuella sp. HZG-20]|uniref:DUF1127 domain-containing protein n=1 Tax=Paludibacillus litoralis TaxID=3133267 RepID=UPI0030EC601B
MSNYLTKHMLDPVSFRNAADNGAVRRGAGALRRWLSATVQRWRRRKTIQALESLDDRMLADIGIHRDDIPHVAAALETRRPRLSPAPAESDRAPEPDRNALREAA